MEEGLIQVTPKPDGLIWYRHFLGFEAPGGPAATLMVCQDISPEQKALLYLMEHNDITTDA